MPLLEDELVLPAGVSEKCDTVEDACALLVEVTGEVDCAAADVPAAPKKERKSGEEDADEKKPPLDALDEEPELW